LLSTYFILGDLEELASLLTSAGLELTTTSTKASTLRFGSIDELVMAEVQSTPLAERLGEEALGRILEDSRDALQSFRTEDGTVAIPIRGHVATARKH
jgi:hypothetical protein